MTIYIIDAFFVTSFSHSIGFLFFILIEYSKIHKFHCFTCFWDITVLTNIFRTVTSEVHQRLSDEKGAIFWHICTHIMGYCGYNCMRWQGAISSNDYYKAISLWLHIHEIYM